MAKPSSQDSFSKRHFHWTNKVSNEEEEEDDDDHNSFNCADQNGQNQKPEDTNHDAIPSSVSSSASPSQRRNLQAIAISRLRSVFTAFAKNRLHHHQSLGLGTRVIGTLFGHRRGHVHFAFQKDASSQPAFLVELATPISGLVKEMASGLVRIALECDKEKENEGREKKKQAAAVVTRRLLEEPRWRTYCNGKRCGFATKRECGPREWKLLKAVEPISMGAGVLPAAATAEAGDGIGSGEDDRDSDHDHHVGAADHHVGAADHHVGASDHGDGNGEIMYMRAKFERVVGSRDSEAFYMMNPDSNGAPELSIYLLRV